MVKLLIVRHAKTEWNKTGRIQGRSDVPLAEESREQSAKLWQQLADKEISAVFSSPLSRAVDTAKLITDGRYEIVTDARLIERDFGEYEGKTYAELNLADHDKLFFALDGVKDVEKSESIFNRVRSFVEDVKKTYDGKTVLVVSHGVCISFLKFASNHKVWNEKLYDMGYVKNLTLTEITIGEDEE